MLIDDRYEIDDLPLGRGGMGAVHQGRDLRLDRRVAVKLLQLPGSDDEVQQRFAREARIVAKLEHPGVPVLYDFGTYEQRLFQVMQFVDGVTVADLVGEYGPLPEAWAANIAAQTAAVLAAAHERGICHRDLKPTNLMLCPDGAVKVLDFGLALLQGERCRAVQPGRADPRHAVVHGARADPARGRRTAQRPVRAWGACCTRC